MSGQGFEDDSDCAEVRHESLPRVSVLDWYAERLGSVGVYALRLRHPLPSGLPLATLNRCLTHLIVIPVLQRQGFDPIDPLSKVLMAFALRV